MEAECEASGPSGCEGISFADSHIDRIGEHLERDDEEANADADRAVPLIGTGRTLSRNSRCVCAVAGILVRTTGPERWL